MGDGGDERAAPASPAAARAQGRGAGKLNVSARRREGFVHLLRAGRHELVADEPERLGGTDLGPNPQELLALSLAACTAATVELYAERKGWDVGRVEVDVAWEPPGGSGHRGFDLVLKLPADLEAEQRKRLETVAEKCPVRRIVTDGVEVRDRVELHSAARGTA